MLLESYETQLVEKARTGDQEAFSELYLLYFERIYRYVRLQVGCQADAEDITSAVFCNAWRMIQRFTLRRENSFASWLYQIARNGVIDRARRPHEVISLDTSDSYPYLYATDPGPESQIERQVDMDELYSALGQLNSEQREVILLRFVEGLSAREVGRIMDKNEGAVRGMQFRALEALRRALAREEREEREGREGEAGQ